MSVLMIGLDGATYDILDKLVERKTLRFFGELMQDGVRADLMSTRNPLTPPAWTSMMTGRSPEIHGIYDFLRPVVSADGGVFLKINDRRDNRCETLWSIASRSGVRSNSLNFFGMSPPPVIDGNVVSGFVPWKHLRHGTYPPSLFDTLKAIDGLDYRYLGMDISEEKKCVQGLVEGEHDDWILLQGARDTAWAKLTCHLLANDPAEFTAVVLDGPDKVQHLFWRYLDEAHFPAERDAEFERIRALCLDYYRILDENIANMVAAAGPGCDVIFTSDHGFGATTEIVYINEWLARKEYLVWSDNAQPDRIGQLTADHIKDHLGMIDWKSTVAFCPTPSSNSIYVKVDHGSGNGVKPDDYLEFCLRLRSELLSLRGSDGEAVVIRADLNKARGISYAEPCPDITLRLRDGGFVSILKSSDVVVQRSAADGTHRPRGIFVGHGPSFGKGASVDPLSILDVAPLILTLLGIPVPSDLEGRVPAEALATVREVKTGASTSQADRPSEDREEPSDEERQALMSQLRILGYMD
jgi:predicted AlkP superfamily phosphohydrolase/phosphomutase